MTGPDQERSEPSAALIVRAVTDLYLSIPAHISDREYRFDRAATPILTRLVEATERAAKREALAKMANEIPSNWCDPLLTGAGSALHGKPGTWNCQDVERLLGSIRKRVNDALSALESSGEAK